MEKYLQCWIFLFFWCWLKCKLWLREKLLWGKIAMEKLHSRFWLHRGNFKFMIIKNSRISAYEHKFNEFPWRFSSSTKAKSHKRKMKDFLIYAKMHDGGWWKNSYSVLWCFCDSLHLIIEKFAKLKSPR